MCNVCLSVRPFRIRFFPVCISVQKLQSRYSKVFTRAALLALSRLYLSELKILQLVLKVRTCQTILEKYRHLLSSVLTQVYTLYIYSLLLFTCF